MKYATLRNIADYLNTPALPQMKNKALALLFLPDILDNSLLDDSCKVIEWSAKALSYLVDGNYSEYDKIDREKCEEIAHPSTHFGYKAGTNDLLDAIKNDAMIVYRKKLGQQRCREDMWNKINYLISRTSPESLDRMFYELTVLPFVSRETYNEVVAVIQELAKKKNYNYALFILVLTAVFRGEIEKLSILYSKKAIQEAAISFGVPYALPDDCVYFTDDNYVDRTYQVYMYRNIHGADRLFEKGEFRIDYTSKIPSATLEISDSYKEPCSHRYIGTPMQTGKTVYIPMGDIENNNSLGILCFEYEKFNNNLPMYFRTGLLLTCNYRFRTPQIQKVIIASKSPKSMKASDLLAIKGYLRTSGGKTVLTDAELDAFCTNEEIAEEEWMQKFKTWILPNLKREPFTSCCITEDTIRNTLKGQFPSEELSMIAFVLKEYSESHWVKKDTFITCGIPEDFHYLMRDTATIPEGE